MSVFVGAGPGSGAGAFGGAARLSLPRTRARAVEGVTVPTLSKPCAGCLYLVYILSMVDLEELFMSVPHALLALLSEGPKYGLRLQNEFEARTGEVWPLNVGQVYTTLQRLERDGLVETDEAGRALAEALPDHLRRRPRTRPTGFARHLSSSLPRATSS